MKKIPKILHLYWDGNPMSFLQSLTVVSFHKYNPDWKIVVHVPDEEYKGRMRFNFIPDYVGQDYFNTVSDLDYVNINVIDLAQFSVRKDVHGILRSDIFRYNILYNEGGVWSDFDVLWLKPVEHFANTNYFGDVAADDISAVVSFITGVGGGHSIGILMHAKEDPYIGSVIELTKRVKPPFSHEVFGSVMLSAAYPTLDSIRSKYPKTVGARFETYYPYNIHPPNKTIQNLYRGVNLEPLYDNNVLCLHWYNGHVLSKAYINKNGMSTNCTMTALLKREGYIQ
jgi:hypothetical protein